MCAGKEDSASREEISRNNLYSTALLLITPYNVLRPQKAKCHLTLICIWFLFRQLTRKMLKNIQLMKYVFLRLST